MALVRGELNDGDRQYVLGHPSLPSDSLVLEVLHGSHHEERPGTMELVGLREEVVRTVKDVVRTGLYRYLLRRLGILDGSSRNMEKRRYLGLHII